MPPPQILDSCVEKVMKSGKSKSSAFGICTSQLQKSGVLKSGTQELTDKGKRRSALLSAMRDRR